MTSDPLPAEAVRLLDLDRESLAGLRGSALTAAVAASEGRTIVAEVVAGAQGLVSDVHDAEVVAALGADVVVHRRDARPGCARHRAPRPRLPQRTG